MRVIAYAYDADHHCESCTIDNIRKYHPALTDDEVAAILMGDDVRGLAWTAFGDSEGNPFHPVFSTDEWYNIGEGKQTMVCTDCLGELDTYEEDQE